MCFNLKNGYVLSHFAPAVDTLCLQKTKWKESKVRNIGGAANYSTMELMVKKWDKDSGEGRAV